MPTQGKLIGGKVLRAGKESGTHQFPLLGAPQDHQANSHSVYMQNVV